MVRYFTINGVEQPADFSIMTLAQLGREYNTDITGLYEVFKGFANEVDYIEAVATIGMCALNAGAKREGIAESYTKYDLYDILTRDMSLAEQFINALFESMQGEAVFQKPPMTGQKEAKRKTKGV